LRKALSEEVLALGGDPADQIWLWLLLRGPHGPSFTWGQSRGEPPGYVGVEHLQEIVDEMASADPTFLEQAKMVAIKAMNSNNPNIIRRGIQVAAVVGARNELKVLASLKTHGDNDVSADARAGEFYLKRRMKGIE